MGLKDNKFNDNFPNWLDDNGVELATLMPGQKVSDNTLRKYFGDNYDQTIQLYGKEHLLPFDR